MLRVIFLTTVFFLLPYPILSDDDPTVTYIANTKNPPHGCPNYGLCTNVTSTLYSETNTSIVYEYECAAENCYCVHGVTNTTTTCDTIENQCENSPCGNDTYFVCTSGINTYTCTCQSGYTGTNCSVEIGTACASGPCQNGATCTSDSSSSSSDYNCTCVAGYTGSDCEYKDLCYNMNCNNGNCTMVLENYSHYYCECDEGYQGSQCEASDYIYTDPIEDGCWHYDAIAYGTTTTKFSDSYMTVDMCNSYALAQTTTMNYLTLCGTWCAVSDEQLTNSTAWSTDSGCKKTCAGNSSEKCGQTSSRCMLYEAGTVQTDPDPCTDTTLCNATSGNGICVNWRNTTYPGYGCFCGAFWTGSDCNTPVESACESNPCVNGTCLLNPQLNTYTCSCEDGFEGTNCQYTKVCNSSICLYGGTCTDLSTGGYKCHCLSLYSGSHCENIDRCDYATPCVNGTCSSAIHTFHPNFTCTCDAGFTGTLCDTEINYCDQTPCAYNSTCTPFFNGYNCTCLAGLTGVNCSTIIDLCVGSWSDGVWVKSPCNTKDSAANCTPIINGYNCTCSDKWTDTLCDLNVIIKDVLIAIYGYVDLNMISLLNDLMTNPSEIKDMVPFITGLLTDSEREDLSWDVGDLFNWIAFEDKRLNLDTDIYKWNDVVLGNCFTFNHREQNFTYQMRSSGKHGGILAFMKTDQDEYAPWYDTAAINVFIHNREEYVFSESVRYNAQPNAQATINIFATRYTRLGGKYGKCVTETSEVKDYYYPGAYTTDGCLRTCYQDMIQSACDCMDPRYPKASNATSCQLSERSCVTDASDAAGDPSTWSSCVCPLPCSNQEYSVTWSKADFVNLPISCAVASDVDSCTENYVDNLMISIVLPQLDYKIYAETASMDFNKFLSQLGGQLGVLMGVNLVTFIEFGFLMVSLIMVCCKKYE